jgi:hypothetical protein
VSAAAVTEVAGMVVAAVTMAGEAEVAIMAEAEATMAGDTMAAVDAEAVDAAELSSCRTAAAGDRGGTAETPRIRIQWS